MKTESTNWHTITMAKMETRKIEELEYIYKDATEAAEAGETDVMANVFAGSEYNRVELRLDESASHGGATDEEQIMVAGFAGGLGLSGNACGALSTAIWMNSLKWVKENPDKSAFKNKNAKATLNLFNTETNSEMLCHKICQQHFRNLEEHTQFIKNGGCSKLIETLAKS